MSTAITATIAALHRLVAMFNGIDLSDDRGVEDSPAKMIWIAAAIIIAGSPPRSPSACSTTPSPTCPAPPCRAADRHVESGEIPPRPSLARGRVQRPGARPPR